jgi:EmrB/QacA subfamily drug resistance transporter
MSVALPAPCDRGVLESAPAAPCDRATARWVLAATILGSSMAFIDGTVVGVALPVIQKSLGASPASAQWVTEAYLLFLSALVLTSGSLADRIGRRRIFASGVALFAVASLACAAAPSAGILIASRAVQGVAASMMIPSSLAILGAANSPKERGRAIGAWSSLTAIATAIGPLLGGWLTETVSWRAVFLVNLPVAAAVLAITLSKVPETRNALAGRIDVPGSILATVGLAAVVFALIEAPSVGWSDARTAAALVGGVLALTGFVLVERKSTHPMLPLALFRNRVFTGANLLTFFLYAAVGAALFLLPFELIQSQGYSPTKAGMALLPLIALVFLLSRPAGALADRIGPRWPLIVGPAIAALGFFLLSTFRANAPYAVAFLPGIAVLGLGMGITVAPLTTAVLNAVDRDEQGVASGINNAVSRVGGLIAIAAIGLVAGASVGPTGTNAHAGAAPFVAAFRTAMRLTALLAVLASASALVFVKVKIKGDRPRA